MGTEVVLCVRQFGTRVAPSGSRLGSVQLTWPESHPSSHSPLPHLHMPNGNRSPNQSHNCPLYQIPNPLLHHGRYETRHSWHPLEIPTPPPSNTRMICSQN